jgi:hypothetical protein
MYSTQAYIYQQQTRVLMMDSGDGTAFPYRYSPVYAKKLTINKGVDNVILFQFVNQEEKPVNITGSSFLFRAVSQNGGELLTEQPLVVLNGPTGRAKVTLSSADLLNIEAQPASYSLSRTQPGGLTEAVFTDAQAGARAPVDIVDSVFPQFIPSSELTIPTTELSNQVTYDGASYGNYPGWNWYWQGNPNTGSYYNSWLNTEFFSSFVEPRGPVTTIQMDLVGFTGTIKAQGAENYQSIWYNVPVSGFGIDSATGSTTFYNETRTIHVNILGWHPILRLAFNNSIFSVPDQPGIPALAYAVCENGVVVDIVLQNQGSGYLAAPKIDIIGNGSGATAEAEINGLGEVTNITVTNGGSGYWPVPNQNYTLGAQQVPVPPSQQGAIVNIPTGYVPNFLYR